MLNLKVNFFDKKKSATPHGHALIIHSTLRNGQNQLASYRRPFGFGNVFFNRGGSGLKTRSTCRSRTGAHPRYGSSGRGSRRSSGSSRAA